jgi:hypothetical protein
VSKHVEHINLIVGNGIETYQQTIWVGLFAKASKPMVSDDGLFL